MMTQAEVDPHLYALLHNQQTLLRADHLEQYAPGEDQRVHVNDIDDANLVSSELVGHPSQHIIALDLDVPTYLVPSSTKDHSHLYVNTLVAWPKYEALLLALGDAGVLEPGYVSISIERRATHLRLPWIKKESSC